MSVVAENESREVPIEDIAVEANLHHESLIVSVKSRGYSPLEPPVAPEKGYLVRKAHHNEVGHTKALKPFRQGPPIRTGEALSSKVIAQLLRGQHHSRQASPKTTQGKAAGRSSARHF